VRVHRVPQHDENANFPATYYQILKSFNFTICQVDKFPRQIMWLPEKHHLK